MNDGQLCMDKSSTLKALTSPSSGSLLERCLHCGLCLQVCPTYALFKREPDSPRGRIRLMQAASEGRIPLLGAFQDHLMLCLDCRACEAACPSKVEYGLLYETARNALEKVRRPRLGESMVRWFMLRQMLPHRGRLRLVARLLFWYQRLHLQSLVRRIEILPRAVSAMESLLPPLSLDYPDYSGPAPSIGPQRGTVAFFRGCIQDAFLAGANAATIRVLQRNGYKVDFPPGQTCCGAAQWHTGDEPFARELARRNIDAFMTGDYDAIINNAGGCGAALKEYARLFENDPSYAEKARRFAERVQDLSEFLAGHLIARPQGEIRARVAYSDSCHLRNVQKVIEEPRDLLGMIPGIRLIELENPDHCCGSAGIYNILQAHPARQILDRKIAEIRKADVQIVVSANTGCHLQLVQGVRSAGINVRVLHLAELLEQSYQNEARAGSGHTGVRVDSLA